MMNTRFMVGLFCGLLSAPVFANESYLCIVDMATGFAFNKSQKRWYSADFKTDGKYVVNKATAGEFAWWEVKAVGDIVPIAQCEKGFTVAGSLFCSGSFHEFRMNKDNLRFLVSYLIGYWTDDNKSSPSHLYKEGKNTPSIAIGRCSPL